MAKRTLIMHRARNRGVVGVRGSGGTWFTTGPSINAGGQTPNPFQVVADQDVVGINPGGRLQVGVTVSNDTGPATNAEVTAVSSDPTVAVGTPRSVSNAQGRVIVDVDALAVGEADITVTSGGVSDVVTCRVNRLEDNAEWELLTGQSGPSALYLSGTGVVCKNGPNDREEIVGLVGSTCTDVDATCDVYDEYPGTFNPFFPLVVRALGDDSAITMRSYNNEWQVHQRIAGTWTKLATAPFTGAATPFPIRLRVIGDQVEWWLNNVQQTTVTTTWLSAGQVGVYDYGDSVNRVVASGHSYTALAPFLDIHDLEIDLKAGKTYKLKVDVSGSGFVGAFSGNEGIATVTPAMPIGSSGRVELDITGVLVGSTAITVFSTELGLASTVRVNVT